MTKVWMFYDSETSISLRAFSFDQMLADLYYMRHPRLFWKEDSIPDDLLGGFMYLYAPLQIHEDYVTDETGTYTIAMDATESDELTHACERISDKILEMKLLVEKLPLKESYKDALKYLINEEYTFNTNRLEKYVTKNRVSNLLEKL